MENYQQILQQGIRELAIPADDNVLELLQAFIQLLEKWNKTYNLTAIKQRDNMVRLHILDSLTALAFIKGQQVADIGTGAGLPGIPLAIFLPHTEFTLVDSSIKKTRFVQQAILELKLKNVTILHSRVEDIQLQPIFSTIIMRAFVSLQNMLQLTQHLLSAHGILLAMQGRQPNNELLTLTTPHTIIPVHIPGVDTKRCLIQINKAQIDKVPIDKNQSK